MYQTDIYKYLSSKQAIGETSTTPISYNLIRYAKKGQIQTNLNKWRSYHEKSLRENLTEINA